MHGSLTWLSRQLRDAAELILLPGIAVLMPWPWAFRLFRLLARCQWLYAEASQLALRNASAMGYVPDAEQWLRQRRLLTLIDHADLYLVWTRSDAWMARHVSMSGQWPQQGLAGLVCTFHWGAGMWSLRSAAAAGLKVHALVAPLKGAHFAGRPVLHAYARWRTSQVKTILNQETLDVAGSLKAVLQALAQNEQVLGVLDVPSDQVVSSEPVRLLDRTTRMPRGLLRLACERQVPLTVFMVGLDWKTGRRHLELKTMPMRPDVAGLSAAVFDELDRNIRVNSAAWHFWSEAERFFGPIHRAV